MIYEETKIKRTFWTFDIVNEWFTTSMTIFIANFFLAIYTLTLLHTSVRSCGCGFSPAKAKIHSSIKTNKLVSDLEVRLGPESSQNIE